MARVATVLLRMLCVAPLAANPVDAASDAAIRQQCLAMAERMWPSGTGEISPI
jgi:hypothetical protein